MFKHVQWKQHMVHQIMHTKANTGNKVNLVACLFSVCFCSKERMGYVPVI